MALQDPVVAYDAANNVEATIVRDTLADAGIEAFAVEDLTPIGTWMFGLLPGIHKPQVWIERANLDRARPVLEEFEREASSRRRAAGDGESIDVECEECQNVSRYAPSCRGHVEVCSHCGAFVDVGDPEDLQVLDHEDLLDDDELDGNDA